MKKKPVFPGCDEVTEKEQLNCFNKHILKHTQYTKTMRKLNLEGKVYINFTINKEGKVENTKSIGGHPLLREEAFRVIKLLPQMKPVIHREKPVKVICTIPISFKLI